MPTIKNIFLSKYDQFNNALFTCQTAEPNFNKLKKYHAKLEKKKINTFLPIFSSDEYASIRLKPGMFKKLEPRARYNIEFSIKRKEKDDKIFINCYLDNCVLVSKAEPIDYGIDVNLSD